MVRHRDGLEPASDRFLHDVIYGKAAVGAERMNVQVGTGAHPAPDILEVIDNASALVDGE
jgi:hypothetical protein